MKISSSVFASFCLMIEISGIALFLRGFFPAPIKSSFSSKMKLSDLPAEPLTGNNPNSSTILVPLFHRVVIILIDALREDFVFGAKGQQYMPYTQHLVEWGSSHSFVAKARAPTVTMPRIKALTTGSIPGFIDVVMNLNSPVLLEDNLLWQAKAIGKRIIFYGDDTWIRLFPKHFMEYDGTTSFFVSDYTEVDNNVTRHLDSTLKRDDWDILILHYLGLDHIGHLSGPHSSLIGPKLLEMDDILRKIHSSLTSQETEGSLPNLLVLCGDHGMSETGSHGGSSDPEINTPLVLISSAFKRKVYQAEPIEEMGKQLEKGSPSPILWQEILTVNDLVVHVSRQCVQTGQSRAPGKKPQASRETPLLSLGATCPLQQLQQRNHHPSILTPNGSGLPDMVPRLGATVPSEMGMDNPGTVEQVDVLPTLALGLGLPISQNNVGRLISPVFEHTSLRDQLRFMHLNSFQLICLLKDSTPNFQKEEGYEQFHFAEKSHGNWIKLYLEGNTSEVLSNLGRKVLRQYVDALKALSSALSKQLGKYDIYSMIVGMVLVLQVLMVLLLAMPEALSRGAEVEIPLTSTLLSLPFYMLWLLCCSIHVLVCTSAGSSCYLCNLSWIPALAAITTFSAMLCMLLSMAGRKLASGAKTGTKNVNGSGFSELDVLLLIGTLGNVISLGSSSFIEEEHQTWYFMINTLCLVIFQDVCCKYFRERRNSSDDDSYLASKQDLPSLLSPISEQGIGSHKWLALSTPLLTLACCRLLRSLNQTGVQWMHLPDLSHWLNRWEHKAELSLLSAASLLLIFFFVQKCCSLVSKIALALGLLGVYSYRAAVGNVLFPWQLGSRDISKGTVEARFVYIFILGILFTGSKDLLRSQVITADSQLKSRGLWEVYSGIVLLCALLFRPHNLPVLACSLLIQTTMAQYIWKELQYDAAQTTIMHYWFGQAFFYFQGNSNNIATVDISAGFIGLESYLAIPAIFLTAFSTYSGPLLWACHLVCYLSSAQDSWNPASVGHGCYCFALLRSIPTVVYIILVTALRYHLFIWSVFSPKLLYEAMNTLVTTVVCIFFTAMDQNHIGQP